MEKSPWKFVPGEEPTHLELVQIATPGEDSVLYHGADWPMKPQDRALIEAAPLMLQALKEIAVCIDPEDDLDQHISEATRNKVLEAIKAAQP